MDLAEYVKKHNGFLDQTMGQKFAEKIFSKGASMDCKEALESFTERPLSLDALHRYVSDK